jgi:hypothetical protein
MCANAQGFFDFFNKDLQEYIFYLLNAQDCFALSIINKNTYFVITKVLYPALLKKLDFFVRKKIISDEQISKIRLILKNHHKLSLDMLHKYLNKKSPFVRPITDYGKKMEIYNPSIYSCYFDSVPFLIKCVIENFYGNIFDYEYSFRLEKYNNINNHNSIIISCDTYFSFYNSHYNKLCIAPHIFINKKLFRTVRCYVYICGEQNEIDIQLFDDLINDGSPNYKVYDPLLVYVGRCNRIHMFYF